MFHWTLTCSIDPNTKDMLFKLYAIGPHGKLKIGEYVVTSQPDMPDQMAGVASQVNADFSAWVNSLSLSV